MLHDRRGGKQSARSHAGSAGSLVLLTAMPVKGRSEALTATLTKVRSSGIRHMGWACSSPPTGTSTADISSTVYRQASASTATATPLSITEGDFSTATHTNMASIDRRTAACTKANFIRPRVGTARYATRAHED